MLFCGFSEFQLFPPSFRFSPRQFPRFQDFQDFKLSVVANRGSRVFPQKSYFLEHFDRGSFQGVRNFMPCDDRRVILLCLVDNFFGKNKVDDLTARSVICQD